MRCRGVGLFRTEFLFLDRGDMPDEQEQYEAYEKWSRAWPGGRSPSAPSTSAPTRI
jgi:phosphoenolpyruvate-protein kinase (PTS system EI component)